MKVVAHIRVWKADQEEGLLLVSSGTSLSFSRFRCASCLLLCPRACLHFLPFLPEKPQSALSPHAPSSCLVHSSHISVCVCACMCVSHVVCRLFQKNKNSARSLTRSVTPSIRSCSINYAKADLLVCLLLLLPPPSPSSSSVLVRMQLCFTVVDALTSRTCSSSGRRP